MPPTFKDKTGRDWVVELTTGAVKRARRLTGFDLLGENLADAMARLAGDPVLLIDVLYAVVQPEAEKNGISDEQFGELFCGDSLGNAVDAFLDAVVAFSQNPRERRALGQALEAARRHTDKKLDLMEEAIRGGALERAIEDAGRPGVGRSGPTSTGLPG